MNVFTYVTLVVVLFICTVFASEYEPIVKNQGQGFTTRTHLHAIYQDMIKYFDHLISEKILEKEHVDDQPSNRELQRAGRFVDTYRNILVHEGLDLDLKDLMQKTTREFSAEELKKVKAALDKLEGKTLPLDYKGRNNFWKEAYVHSAHEGLLSSKNKENKGQFMHFLRIRSMLQGKFNALMEQKMSNEN